MEILKSELHHLPCTSHIQHIIMALHGDDDDDDDDDERSAFSVA